MQITVLAGGVGAARFLTGLLDIVDGAEVTVIVNTGDDMVLHGLHISPDIDTITYTLADAVNPDTGWGLRGETWEAMSALDRYGGQTWFRLGDRDLATHLYRTQRLGEGASLSEVTAEVASAWGLTLAVLPMSDAPAPTMVTLQSGETIGFQQWFVGQQHQTHVAAISSSGASRKLPGPKVLDAIDDADRIVIAPSNPIVSIGPILDVPGVREVLEGSRDRTVAISPIIAGKALKGPADQLMTDLGHEASVVGVARLYETVASALVIDDADQGRASEVDKHMACIVGPTIMKDRATTAALAKLCLGAI